MNTCQQCGGIGQVPVAEVRQGSGRHGRYVMTWTACPVCVGSGREIRWTAEDLATAQEISNLEMAATIRAYLAGATARREVA